jgi:phosphatidylglycerophosphate synthase
MVSFCLSRPLDCFYTRPRNTMATFQPHAVAEAAPGYVVAGPRGWKRRLEDPFNTYYRYPAALAITRALLPTPITPNQVSLVQPLFAAAAGWAVTHDDWRYHLAAVGLFELRSILDCVDGSLARAKNLSSPNGHAVDAIADWLGVVFLYLGIFHYFWHHPPSGVASWAAILVVASALLQGALRSISSDHFKTKLVSIFERKRDEGPTALREKLLALRQGASTFTQVDAFILWVSHLLFEGERFDHERSQPLSDAAVRGMVAEESSLRTRLLGFGWSISSGDAFLSFVIVSIVAGQLWAAQVFFATAGWVWILGFLVYNVVFFRARRRAALVAPQDLEREAA